MMDIYYVRRHRLQPGQTYVLCYIQKHTYKSFLQFILDADELLYWSEKLELDHGERYDMVSFRLEQENVSWLKKQEHYFSLNMLFCDRVRSQGMHVLLTKLDKQGQNIKLHLFIEEIEDLLNHGEYKQVADAMTCL